MAEFHNKPYISPRYLWKLHNFDLRHLILKNLTQVLLVWQYPSNIFLLAKKQIVQSHYFHTQNSIGEETNSTKSISRSNPRENLSTQSICHLVSPLQNSILH